ncbi:MAG: FAD-dependent oxidoreductase [Spirochaetales bacterium]|nr:FAD-dependent oxidoreductase [Spirochaetales bacterium]
MREKRSDVVVVGGGSAGLAAACRIAAEGYSVTILERENELGGILNQCIHNGFGLQRFKEDLTGPEYAERFIEEAGKQSGIDVLLETTALEVSPGLVHTVYGYSRHGGVTRIDARSIVLAMGCRERNRGNIGIPGTRPSGVFTAGLAQRLINIDGYIPGRRAVILGSGDIGLIMARRLTWVGVKVLGVIEIQSYPSGLTRNIVQCLNDFAIPLHLSHTVSEIRGRDRVEGVTVVPMVDGRAVPEKSFDLECDTILLSVGLIPDNELSRKFGVCLNPETGGAFVDGGLMSCVPGVFACGNVLHVHDLVDYVSEESERCASFVIEYLEDKYLMKHHPVAAGANVKYVVPNRYLPGRDNRFYLRSLIVKNKAELVVTLGGQPLKSRKLAHVQPSEMVSFQLDAADLAPDPDSQEKKLEVGIY